MGFYQQTNLVHPAHRNAQPTLPILSHWSGLRPKKMEATPSKVTRWRREKRERLNGPSNSLYKSLKVSLMIHNY